MSVLTRNVVVINFNKLLIFSMVQAQVKPCLDKLNSDADIDVKYYAQEALTGKTLSMRTRCEIMLQHRRTREL